MARESKPHVFDNGWVYSDDLRAMVADYDDSRKDTVLSVLSQTGVGADILSDTALKVTSSSTPGSMDVAAGTAIDSNGELIYVPENVSSGDLQVPDFPDRQAIGVPTTGAYSDGVTYYVKIAYAEIAYEYETDPATQTSHPTRYLRAYTITIDTSPAEDPEVLLATIVGGDGGSTFLITDSRTLLSGRITAITDDSVASDAGIGQEKIDNTDIQDDAYAGTPSNLAHDLNQVRTVIRSHKDVSVWTGLVAGAYQHYSHDVYVVDVSGSFGGLHTVESCLDALAAGGLSDTQYAGTIDIFNFARSSSDYTFLTGASTPPILNPASNAVHIKFAAGNSINAQITIPKDYATGTDLYMRIHGHLEGPGSANLICNVDHTRNGVDTQWAASADLVSAQVVSFTSTTIVTKSVTIPGTLVQRGDVIHLRINCTSLGGATAFSVGGWTIDYSVAEAELLS